MSNKMNDNYNEIQKEIQDERPALNQISYLSDIIKRNENLKKHFDLTDCWSKLNKIKSVKQLRYFHYLLLNNKYIKLNIFMVDIGFQRKKLTN